MGISSPGFGFASVSLMTYSGSLASLSKSKPFILVFNFWSRTWAIPVGTCVDLESRSSDKILEVNQSRAHENIGSVTGGELGGDNT